MWFTDRRSFLVSLAALAGCGFTPAYGPDGGASALRGTIAPDAPATRDDFALTRRLAERLGPTEVARYRLAYTITTTSSAQAVTTDSITTRYLLQGEASYQLIDIGSGAELLALGITEAEYDAWLINIEAGDQFGSDFVAINPNSKIPALLDCSVEPAQRVFESGAILLYLAEKFGHFLPAAGPARAECLSWLFWHMGSAPFLGGGFGHFYAYAPEKYRYPIDRYAMEVKRQLDVLDRHLAGNEYLAGADYSLADIGTWPWYGALALGRLYDAGEFLQVDSYSHVQRWAQAIADRPAVKRGRMVNRAWGNPASQLLERHEASDFEQRTQDKLGSAGAR